MEGDGLNEGVVLMEGWSSCRVMVLMEGWS